MNDILATLAMAVLDCGGSRTISIDFMNNPYHGYPDEDEDELRRMAARDGTTKCHCYCTAFVIARGKPLTLALEPVDGDDSKVDAGERSDQRNLWIFGRNFGSAVRAQFWYREFREIILKFAISNIEQLCEPL